MKRFLRAGAVLAALALIVCALSGCAGVAKCERSFLRMDTVITVRLYGASDGGRLLDECGTLLSEIDARLSATVPESDVFRFNASADGSDAALDPETLSLIDRAIGIGEATDGAFDITVAPLGALWKTCEAAGRLPSEEELAGALALVGTSHLSRTDGALVKDAPGVRIDLGGIGKGYAADALLSCLEASDATGGLINFGSNVAVFGKKPDGTPFRVALRDPNDPAGTVGTLTLDGTWVLSVSGDYERYFEIDGKKYGHIQEPATGFPPQNGLRSVAVLAADGVTADALSTALTVLGEEAGRALRAAGTFSFEAVFVYDDHVSTTEGVVLE